LISMRYMCLNMLFSVAEEGNDDAPPSFPVPVTLSCAFRLPQCAQRLAKELVISDEQWEATERDSDEEKDAGDVLCSWLQVGELLVKLCRTAVVHCPTVGVFLSIITPGGNAPEQIEPDALSGTFGDVQEALGRIIGRRRSESIQQRGIGLLGELKALHASLREMQQGSPPSGIPREDLCPPERADVTMEAASGSTRSSSRDSGIEDSTCADEEMDDFVRLFEDASALEGAAEWIAAAELDSTDSSAEGGVIAWEFDAVAHRMKRKAALDKLESDRKAKRLKQIEAGQQIVMVPPPKAAQKPAAPEKPAAAAPAPAAQTAPAAAPVVPSKPQVAAGSAEALQSFLKDHPEFMRVLQNPKKALSDPRVKSMFVSELQNYPLVKAFLATKGLKLD